MTPQRVVRPTGAMRTDSLSPRGVAGTQRPFTQSNSVPTRVVADAVHARGAGGIADLTTGAAHLGVGRADNRHRGRHADVEGVTDLSCLAGALSVRDVIGPGTAQRRQRRHRTRAGAVLAGADRAQRPVRLRLAPDPRLAIAWTCASSSSDTHRSSSCAWRRPRPGRRTRGSRRRAPTASPRRAVRRLTRVVPSCLISWSNLVPSTLFLRPKDDTRGAPLSVTSCHEPQRQLTRGRHDVNSAKASGLEPHYLAWSRLFGWWLRQCGPRTILTSYFCTLLPTHRAWRSRTRELSGLPCSRHALTRVVPTGDRAARARFADPALDVLKGGGRLRRCRHDDPVSPDLVALI